MSACPWMWAAPGREHDLGSIPSRLFLEGGGGTPPVAMAVSPSSLKGDLGGT